MCKSIETYATEEAIDAVIRNCVAHKDSLEETISFVKEQFTKVTKEYITSRFEFLSSTTERIHRVTCVSTLEGTRLLLEFDNKESRIFDVKKLQDNKLFQKIIDDKEYFSKVHIDNMGLVCWDEATDINPYYLYDESEPVLVDDERILDALEKVVSKKLRKQEYCLTGYQESSFCLEKNENGYIVYVGERGNKYFVDECSALLMACIMFVKKFTHDNEEIARIERELIDF